MKLELATWSKDGVDHQTYYTAEGLRFWPSGRGYRWAFIWPDDGLGSAHGWAEDIDEATRQAKAWKERGR